TSFVEGGFGDSAKRYVLSRAEILQPIAALVRSTLSNHPDVLDRAVRHDKPVLVVEIKRAASYPLSHFVQHLSVFRMVTGADQLKTHTTARFELEDTIEFVGPREFSRRRIKREASGHTEPLRL